MQEVIGRWKLGLALTLTTTICWGVLPIALKIVLLGLDPYTITWYRFAFSALVLTGLLTSTDRLPSLRLLTGRGWLFLVVVVASLPGNYVLYLVGLAHATPTVTQTVSQLGPMFLLLGGLVVYKERFSRWQWTGLFLLFLGLILFFNRRLPELPNLSGDLGLGVVLLIVAAAVWAAYGLAQKKLLTQLGPQQILLLVYLGAVVILLPSASLGSVRRLNALQFCMLLFTCVNTLIAYGAFAEALGHWQVSRISAVLSTAPLFTIVTMWLIERLVPGLLAPEGLNPMSMLGALLVVVGSATCALNARGAVSRSPSARV